MNFREVEEVFHDLGIQVHSWHTVQTDGEAPVLSLECVYYGDIKRKRKSLEPDRIIKNGPATIVTWPDGTKTIVKRAENEPDDEYSAYTAALAKKLYGSTSAVKRMIERKTVTQKPKKQKDACPIDKPCKAEKSTMDYELGSLNDLARKQYEEFLNQNTAKDEWICPKCGKHYQWQYNEKGRYAFCPSCQLATKTETLNKEK